MRKLNRDIILTLEPDALVYVKLTRIYAPEATPVIYEGMARLYIQRYKGKLVLLSVRDYEWPEAAPEDISPEGTITVENYCTEIFSPTEGTDPFQGNPDKPTQTQARYARVRAQRYARLYDEWRNAPEDLRGDLPPNIRRALDDYVLEHCETGGFLRKLLENDLYGAATHAHAESKACFFSIVALLAYAPANCFGSPEKVQTWINLRHEEAK